MAPDCQPETPPHVKLLLWSSISALYGVARNKIPFVPGLVVLVVLIL